MDLDGLVEAQRVLNRSTAEHWALFAGHRERLMTLIVGHSPGRDRLVVTGAGNCNDLDLNVLTETFREVHLVDIDREAMEAAVRRQHARGVHLHHGTDLTGVWPQVSSLGGPVSPAELDGMIAEARQGARLRLAEPADLVVSAGLLTQLMRSVGDVVGEKHPRIEEIAVALRTGHVRCLLEAVRPGGRVLLVTEVVSNEVIPALHTAEEAVLPGLLHDAIWAGDLFTGTSPPAFVSWLVQERPCGARLVAPGIVGPWRWRQGPRRTLLMVAFILEKPA